MAGADTPPILAARAVRIALPGSARPADAALLVREDPHPFALTGRWAGAAALAGSEPVRVAAAGDDPFALLDAQPAVEGPSPPGFVGGGWVGYLGYRLGRAVEGLGAPPPAPDRLPPFALAFYDHVVRCDEEGRWWFEALWSDARAIVLERRLEAFRARLAGGPPALRPVATGPWHATPTPSGHARAVTACRARIAAGDLFQANLALRLRAPLQGDPVDLFARGVAALSPDRAALVAGSWGTVASLSPELFLERHGTHVRSAPIKGTRPAASDPLALAASEKDRAENIMIVDLVRNDLGRVCIHGSVTVTALAEPRPHAGVWHLVSEVSGRLRDGVRDADLLRATFPPGSVTGAPKVAAMDVISALESAERQVFCGAIGFAGPVAGLELSVAIRTFECVGDQVWLDVGGGVVADSDPAGEAAEALAKATPLLAAVGAPAAAPAPPRRGTAPVPPRLGPRPVPRPDPDAGVFETVLVRDGRPVVLGRHLDRLRASAAALGLAAPSPELAEQARSLAAQHGSCRVRLLANRHEVRAEAAALPASGDAVWLGSVTLPGGLGAHKWRDRRLVDALAAEVAPATALLADLDGLVLEATRANVIVETADGGLVTPPLDGRVLPGVTRARVLERLRVDERPLTLDELASARSIVLTGALRGVEAVAGIDGRALSAPPAAVLSCLAAAAAPPRAGAGTT